MRPCLHMNCILFFDIPHFSAICFADRYSMWHLVIEPINAYKNSIYIIWASANNVKTMLSVRVDKSKYF